MAQEAVFFATSTHWWSMSNWCPPRPRRHFLQNCFFCRHFLQNCFPVIRPPACTGAWGYSSTGAHLAFLSAELPKFVCSFLQPVLVSLNGNTTIWSVSHSSQFLASANLLRAHPSLLPRPPNENVKQNWLQDQPQDLSILCINDWRPVRRLSDWLNTIFPFSNPC